MGWALGGPVGALVGFALGYLWDNASLKPVWSEAGPSDGTGSFRDATTKKGDFVVSLLVLAAAVMRADQRVLKSELRYVKKFLRTHFSEGETLEYLRVLRQLISQDIDIDAVCGQIARFMNEEQRLQLLHFLIGIAVADGSLHRDELVLLKNIASHLHLTEAQFAAVKAMYGDGDERYYEILELKPGASHEEIKAAYRKLAKKYHPDRLGDDIGEEIKKASIEKFRLVQEAYEKLTQTAKFTA
ncbi:MAG: hypothetical protein Kow0075_04620 [Salibacteraceae bacterium]